MAGNENLKINFTEKDIIQCGCGCTDFIQTIKVLRKKSPIIGEPPKEVHMRSLCRCYDCEEPLPPGAVRVK